MVDRPPHLFGKPLLPRVDPAHRALELGQLADHVGREVGLGQPAGLPRERRGAGRRQHLLRHPPRQRLDPQRLGAVAAHPLVEEHGVEARQVILERRPAVRVPEEPRVAQPGHQRALEVPRDRPGVVGLGVDDGQERRQQAALVVDDREEVLVVDHRRRQHLLGKLEELGAEGACDHGRVLDEVGHFLQQARLAGGRAADPAAEPAGVRVEFAGDLGVAVLAVEDDEVLAQPRPVLVERADLDRPPRAAARREEAVAVGDGPRTDVLDDPALGGLETADHEGHDAPAVEEQDPADRPSEQQLAAAVVQLRVPVHLLRKRQVAQHAGQHVRQDVDRRLAADALPEREVVALRRVHALEIRHLDAVLPREPRRGRRRRPVRPEGGGRPAAPSSTSSRSVWRSATRATRTASRLGVLKVSTGASGSRRSAFMRAAVGLADLPGQRRQPAGRDLLAAEFDQQFAIHTRLTPGRPAAGAAGGVSDST